MSTKTKLTREQIESRLKTIVAEQICVTEEEIKPESDLYDDLGADSLDVIELLMAAEEEFNTPIPDEQTEELHTFAKLTDYVFDHQEDT